jgi:hypothetical protein
MQFVAVGRWLAMEWARSPLAWAATAILILLGLTAAVMGPLGIISDGSNGVQFSQIWFVFTFIGVAVGLALLARTGAIWSELGPTAQAGTAAVVLLFLATFHGLLGLVPVSLVGGSHALVGLLPESLGALLCAAHWSALAVFAQRVSLPLSGKPFGQAPRARVCRLVVARARLRSAGVGADDVGPFPCASPREPCVRNFLREVGRYHSDPCMVGRCGAAPHA